jgi:hypothetical protein
MNWATERARRVLNSIGYRENPEAAIAAALQALADECAEAVEDAPCTGRGRYFFAEAIRAKFPKEEV